MISKSISVNPKFLSGNDRHGERRAAVCSFPHRTERSLLTLKNRQKNPKETFLEAAEKADESRGTQDAQTSLQAGRAGQAVLQVEANTDEGVQTQRERKTGKDVGLVGEQGSDTVTFKP